MTDSIYAPRMARLADVRPMTELEKLFVVEFPDGSSLGHQPGQFVMLSIPGVGEAPISVSSSPSRSNGHFELCVRRIGDVTGALHRMRPGDVVGIRGPFGHGFPIEQMRGKDMLFAPPAWGWPPCAPSSTRSWMNGAPSAASSSSTGPSARRNSSSGTNWSNGPPATTWNSMSP